ncbi:MAG TPA: NADP-dependent oxidoreductase [Verrucomicrobiae bacterium]|nr:NADP-dependent oxidoreductase [Verrucomicrobiae bacterium]
MSDALGALVNRQVLLVRRPHGAPSPEDFRLAEAPVRAPAEGEVLVRALYLSMDPAMRGWMSEAKSYMPPVELGGVMRAGMAARVVASRDPAFAPGDHVTGILGAQDYALAQGEELTRVFPDQVPLPVRLSALGVPGMTAYFGLLDLARLRDGDRVLISGAAGAVGSIAGQIAKLKGCKVVGIAGGEAKCRMLTEDLGFDGAIDYKSEDVTSAIRQFFRRGVHVYFDNVGGPILDAALANLAVKARVILCGAISQYNSTEGMYGPKNYLSILVNRATVHGLLVFDYIERYAEAEKDLLEWIAEGKIKVKVDVAEGLEHFPEVLMRLFSGANVGKLILKVAE